MPRPGVEGTIQIRDQMMLNKIKFNLTKKLRKSFTPNILSGCPCYCFVFFGSLSCGFRPGFFPPWGVDVVGVDACSWIRVSNAELGDVFVGERPKRMTNAQSAFDPPAMPPPSSM